MLCLRCEISPFTPIKLCFNSFTCWIKYEIWFWSAFVEDEEDGVGGALRSNGWLKTRNNNTNVSPQSNNLTLAFFYPKIAGGIGWTDICGIGLTGVKGGANSVAITGKEGFNPKFSLLNNPKPAAPPVCIVVGNCCAACCCAWAAVWFKFIEEEDWLKKFGVVGAFKSLSAPNNWK